MDNIIASGMIINPAFVVAFIISIILCHPIYGTFIIKPSLVVVVIRHHCPQKLKNLRGSQSLRR